jgi:hypothetical protein
MLGETKNQFSLTRAARSIGGHPRSKFLSVSVFTVVLLFLVPMAGQAQFVCTTNNGELTIESYLGVSGNLVIPATIDGLPVTGIDGGAFQEVSDLTSIKIPDSVTWIGEVAFAGCVNLTNVVIPPSVSQIRAWTFTGCESLASIHLPRWIGSIGPYAFRDCLSLESVCFRGDAPTASADCFQNSTNVIVYRQPRAWGWGAALAGRPTALWDPCPDFIYDVFNYGSEAVVQYYLGSANDVIVPATTEGLPVTGIGAGCFMGKPCSSVSLPETVTWIGADAFVTCENLQSVNVPPSVTRIEEWAFQGCYNLRHVGDLSGVTSVGKKAFNRCEGLKDLVLPGPVSFLGDEAFEESALLSIGLGEGITNILPMAFFNCLLTNIILPSGLLSIGDDAFHYCPLRQVELPQALRTLGSSAFSECFDLTNVSFGTNLTTIGQEAFLWDSMDSVWLPASLTNLGAGAFGGCLQLTNIAVDPQNAAYSSLDGVLLTRDGTVLVACPAGRNGTYISPPGMTRIGSEAFYACESLQEVLLPKGLLSVGTNAFSVCLALTNVFFQGNAPDFLAEPFSGNYYTTVYYLPGTTGWDTAHPGCPMARWNPTFQPHDSAFGPHANGFGLVVTGTADIPIVLEASPSLSGGSSWTPLFACTLTNGAACCYDTNWTSYPGRFYRIRSP